MATNELVQNAAVNGETKSPEVVSMLTKVDRHLTDGNPQAALELIWRSKLVSPWLQNAIGVCQMRLGQHQSAATMFRSMVVSGTLLLRDDVPAVCKSNYATALLASRNVAGCMNVLSELGDNAHPTAAKLRAAIAAWKANLTVWQKIQWYTGSDLNLPIQLDFPPGDLE